MRRASTGGSFLLALSALAACSPRSALNSGLVTKPGPDGGFEPYTPPADAGDDAQVVAAPERAPEPARDAALDIPIAPPPPPPPPPPPEVTDAAASACPQRQIPDGKFTFVSTGNGSACAIRTDGAMRCWGNLFYPQSAIPTGSFSRVDVYSGACGIRSSGEIACWGGESAAASGGPFLDVGAGEGMSCALRVDGTMQCSGS